MKPSELIRNSKSYPDSRGELTDHLVDAFNHVLPFNGQYLSEGALNDALLFAIDKCITRPDQIKRLQEFLIEREEDGTM